MSAPRVRDQETLLRIVAKLRGDVTEVENDIRRWGRGGAPRRSISRLDD